MTLPTRSDLPMRSPLSSKVVQGDLANERELTLADLTGVGLQHVRSTDTVFRGVNGDQSAEVGDVLSIEGALAARLTDEEWMLITPQGAETALPATKGALLTITDASHGYGVLLITGPDAGLVLSKLSPVEISSPAFPDLHVVQTSLAKVRALVLRRDLHGQPAYLLAVGRSMTEYVWQLLLDAAEEFGPEVVNGEAFIPALIAATRE